MSGFEVVVLAGGKGTRLQGRAGGVPKPLVAVGGVPIVMRQIEACRAHGHSRILLLVHHEAEQIRAALGDGASLGVEIGYREEREPRGTAGALGDALPLLADRFLVLYADTCFDVDLRRFVRAHADAGASATLFLHPNDHPADSDLVEVDAADRVVRILPYPHPSGIWPRNCVNAALYVFDKRGLEALIDRNRPSDIARHLFPAMLDAGLTLHGYRSPEYVKDMGTPERLDRVEADLERGLADRLSGRHLRAAVFLDRDGTVNREVGHLREAAQLELVPGAGAAVQRLNRAGRLAVLVTNQPVVARGETSFAELERIHGRLEWLLSGDHAYLDAVYVCPHHPDRGFAGEVAALKIACDCRKPATGLLDRACRALRIDRAASWIVGDSTRDIACGTRAGVRTVLVRSGHAGRDGHFDAVPDYICRDLPAAVDWILQGHGAVQRQLHPLLAAAAASRLVLIGGHARAGKSTTAQVLKETLTALGQRAHVVGLDGWLRPPAERPEGAGVLARYDVELALRALLPAVDAPRRTVLTAPSYDPYARTTGAPFVHHAIQPEDTLVVEGVPALLLEPLRERAAIAIDVRAASDARDERLRHDYRQRGRSDEELEAMLRSRAEDEAPVVERATAYATHVVHTGSAP